MMTKEDLLAMRIFYSFGILLCLFQILKPELVVRFCAKFFQRYMKFLGLDSTINSTNKAVIIFRIWAIFMLVIIVIMLFNLK